MLRIIGAVSLSYIAAELTSLVSICLQCVFSCYLFINKQCRINTAYDKINRFAAGTRMNEVAESENFIVLYPDQPATANQNKFWNWFETAHQHRGSSDYVVQKINGDQVLSQWAQVNDMLDDGRDNNSIDDTPKTTETKTVEGGRSYTVYSYEDGKGNLLMQKYLLTGMGHAWSGGSSLGNYTDSTGPDASRIIWSFLSGNPIDEGEPENPGGPGEPENPDFEVAYGTATEHYVAGRLNTSEYLQMGSKYGYIARFYLYRLDGTNEWTDVNPIG